METYKTEGNKLVITRTQDIDKSELERELNEALKNLEYVQNQIAELRSKLALFK